MATPPDEQSTVSHSRSLLSETLGKDVYRQIIDAAPDAMLMIDGAGQIMMVNQQVEQLFKYEREQILGQSIEVLLPQRFRGGHVKQRTNYFSAPQVRAMGSGSPLFAQRADGTEFPVEVSLSPMQTPAGPMVLSAIRDVTEATHAKEVMQYVSDQLRAQNGALEQFTFLASHDLQEPLRTIESFSGLLRDELGSKVDESGVRALHYIEESAQRMSRLLHELLEHSRVGHLSSFTPVDTKELVGEVLKDLHAAIDRSQAVITLGDLPEVNGRRAELQLMFQNLISNAIKYRHEEVIPQIKVNASRCSEGWEFEVSDNGIGIDPALSDKVFLPFKRLHSRSEYSGTGMGLAHCRKIADLHGGSICVRPRSTGGSTFHFYLPDAQPRPPIANLS